MRARTLGCLGVVPVLLTRSAPAAATGILTADTFDSAYDTVLTAYAGDRTVLLFNHTPAGTGFLDFQSTPPLFCAVGHSPQALVVADVDGDAKDDVAVANRAGGDVTVWRGNGSAAACPPSVSIR